MKTPCYKCSNTPDAVIPFLTCGCFLCPKCYCDLKNQHINNCLICDRKLRRGIKKNR